MASKRRIHPLTVFSALLGIGIGIYAARTPYLVYTEQKKDLKKMESELKHLQEEQIEKKEKEDLKNPIKREENARRMGLIPKGEVPLK